MKKILILFLLFPILNFSCIFGDDSPDIERKEWTIMVYSNADNNLESYLLSDLKEMESAGVSSKYMRIIVLIDRIPSYSTSYGDWTEAKLYEITYNNSLVIGSKELSSSELGVSTASNNNEIDMGDYNTLSKFVNFCKANYPSEHYGLIIEDHGDGWYTQGSRSSNEIDNSLMVSKSISFDDTSDSYIGTEELNLALGNKGLDIIAMDACFMGTIEVVYELRNCASYIIASPKTIDGKGSNYTRLFETIYDRLGSVENTAKGFVDAFNKEYQSYGDYLLSYETTKITDIVENGDIDSFVNYLKGLNPDLVNDIRNATVLYDPLDNDTDFNIELISFAEQTGYTILSTKLKEAAYCGTNTTNNKIAIYYPDGSYNMNYDDSLDFSVVTTWDEYIKP